MKHIVGFSGGVDSQACARWVLNRYPTFFAPCVPGMATNAIDDVVRWAQTDRGGRQANLLRVLNDRPACESQYGTCE